MKLLRYGPAGQEEPGVLDCDGRIRDLSTVISDIGGKQLLPEKLAALLKMPAGSQPIAILCLGHVEEFYSRPMLELENWAKGRALEDFISENYWPT